MKQKKASSSAPFLNIGTSSFLVVFLVLCLVTFAILSLTTSRGDYNLSRKAADRKTAYYDALNRSETMLEELDESLSSAFSASADYREYLSAVGAALKESAYSLSSEDGRTIRISFDTDLSDRQALSCVLVLNDPWSEPDGGYYTIESRKVVETEQWEGDETITLVSPQMLDD